MPCTPYMGKPGVVLVLCRHPSPGLSGPVLARHHTHTQLAMFVGLADIHLPQHTSTPSLQPAAALFWANCEHWANWANCKQLNTNAQLCSDYRHQRYVEFTGQPGNSSPPATFSTVQDTLQAPAASGVHEVHAKCGHRGLGAVLLLWWPCAYWLTGCGDPETIWLGARLDLPRAGPLPNRAGGKKQRRVSAKKDACRGGPRINGAGGKQEQRVGATGANSGPWCKACCFTVNRPTRAMAIWPCMAGRMQLHATMAVCDVSMPTTTVQGVSLHNTVPAKELEAGSCMTRFVTCMTYWHDILPAVTSARKQSRM